MYFDNIVKKYGYNEKFSEFLKQVYDELVIYYKSEELVYEALLNTEIVNINNVYTYLKENGLLESDNTIVTEDDMKRSSGICHSLPEIVYNKVTNTYEFAYIKRVVGVTNLDLTSTSSKATLIHEICHLVKSYYNEYIIEGNILISHSGLIETYYELSFDGEKIVKKLVKEVGVGLEEGLTSVAEEDIIRKTVDSEYKSSGYGAVNDIARNLLISPEIKEALINAEVYHNKSELFELLNNTNYQALENLSDRIYKLNLEMFATIMDFDKMNEIAEQMKKILKEEYAPLRDSIESDLKRS